MKYKRKRIFKKHLKFSMDWFTREMIPKTFVSESERLQFVSAWVRRQVGQKHRFPERIIKLINEEGGAENG